MKSLASRSDWKRLRRPQVEEVTMNVLVVPESACPKFKGRVGFDMGQAGAKAPLNGTSLRHD